MPARDEKYLYQPAEVIPDPALARKVLRSRVPHHIVNRWVPASEPAVLERISGHFRNSPVALSDFMVQSTDFKAYLEQADYSGRYAGYYPSNREEKSFEHWVALRLLDIRSNDVFVDVASECSPLPEIISRLTGANAFAQDIMYEPGIHGNRIGGDAAHMPVADGFASQVALTCSLEHFEGNGDVHLFRELARVLRPGGRVCIVPLYMYSISAVQTDARYSAACAVPFDEGAVVFCADGWANRHGRFYSVMTLRRRIVEAFPREFSFTVYRIQNTEQIGSSVYARWALLAERR